MISTRMRHTSPSENNFVIDYLMIGQNTRKLSSAIIASKPLVVITNIMDFWTMKKHVRRCLVNCGDDFAKVIDERIVSYQCFSGEICVYFER